MNERAFATFLNYFYRSCSVTRGFIVCLAYRNLSSAVVSNKDKPDRMRDFSMGKYLHKY